MRLNECGELNEELSRWRAENDSLKATQNQLQGEIDRLRSHLLAVEENYTMELLKSQEKEKMLRETLQAAEERMSDQWRKNDKMSGLKEKYRQLELEKQRLEATNKTLELSLEKLQHVLDQFTRERERDIVIAQKELAQKLSRVETLHTEKETEIAHLRKKLAEAQLGLEAAGRLTQQLDNTAAALSVAKEEGNLTTFTNLNSLCTLPYSVFHNNPTLGPFQQCRDRSNRAAIQVIFSHAVHLVNCEMSVSDSYGNYSIYVLIRVAASVMFDLIFFFCWYFDCVWYVFSRSD